MVMGTKDQRMNRTVISREVLPDPADERRPVYSDSGVFLGWFIIEGKAGHKSSRFEPALDLRPYQRCQLKRKFRHR